MSRRLALAAGALAAAGLLGGAPAARARTCARGQPVPPAPAADVVLDGVALWGSQADAELISPARFAVVRYRKGGGPRVVSVRSGFEDELNGVLSEQGGSFRPRAGELWRIRAQLPGRRSRVRRGEILPAPGCGGFRELRPGGVLRWAAGAVGRRGIGAPAPAWRARALRGPAALRCVAVRRLDRPSPQRRACEWIGRSRPAVVAVLSQGAPDHPSTAVVAAGRGLRELEVTGPDRRRVARAGRGHVALLVFAGYLARPDLSVALRFAGDRAARRWPDDAAWRARVRDPDGPWIWTARARRSRVRTCAGFQQDPLRFAPLVSYVGQATCHAGRPDLLFGAEPALPLGPGVDPRTVLAGVAGPAVAGVQAWVAGRPLALALAARGRPFVAVVPPGAGVGALVVRVRWRDGTARLIRGRRTAALWHRG